VASDYGSKPDWSAFGGHDASLRDVEVVVRFRWPLVLDVVGPPIIGHVAVLTTQWPLLAVPDRMAATLVRFHPANLHRKRRDPIRLKAWGFPIPYRGL
jgi:hypothetical protein